LKSNKKNLLLRQKVWKNSERVWKVWKKDRKKFGKGSESSESSEIPNFQNYKNYEKMMFNSKFENHEKLIPTQKPTRKFG
jgi:hypothetical protein